MGDYYDGSSHYIQMYQTTPVFGMELNKSGDLRTAENLFIPKEAFKIE